MASSFLAFSTVGPAMAGKAKAAANAALRITVRFMFAPLWRCLGRDSIRPLQLRQSGLKLDRLAVRGGAHRPVPGIPAGVAVLGSPPPLGGAQAPPRPQP